VVLHELVRRWVEVWAMGGSEGAVMMRVVSVVLGVERVGFV